MKKIIISNLEFDFDMGCKILKLKYDKCPFPELEDFWGDIKPATFKEIAKIPNIEQRRVAIFHFGIERLVKEVDPILVDKKTINKKTTYINSKGELVNKGFRDTYELYKIVGEKLSHKEDKWQQFDDAYYVKCKDTSTDREYLIFVEPRSVYNTNCKGEYIMESEKASKINAIQSVAWTIQTDIPEGGIEKIIRQGDCIMIMPKDKKYKKERSLRHLTEKEYRNLLVAES